MSCTPPSSVASLIDYAYNRAESNQVYNLLTTVANKLDEGDGEADLIPRRLRTMAAVVKAAGNVGMLKPFIDECVNLGIPQDETLLTAAQRIQDPWIGDEGKKLAEMLTNLYANLNTPRTGIS